MQIKKYLMHTAAAVAAAVISAFCLPFCASADTVLPSGYDAAHLNAKLDMLLCRAEQQNDPEYRAPVIGAKVFCGDEVISTVCSGLADAGSGIPVSEDTVFEWGSITKTMIWVSIMQLWEQGRLSLDADISEYLPDDYTFRHREFDDPVTLTDIMNHRSGWCETTYAISTDDPAAIPSLKDALMQTEPVQTYQPGTVTAYSNWASALAALAVENVSGQAFSSYVHENILKPLGMEHTAVAADHSDVPWVSQQRQQLHSYQPEIAGYSDLGQRITYITLYPAGSAVGTIGDLCTYAQAFSDPDAPLFRDPATQQKLFSGSLFLGGIPQMSFGFAVVQLGVRTFGHDGGTISGTAQMLFDPETRTGAVMATTDKDGGLICNKLICDVFGEPDLSAYPAAGDPVSLSGWYVMARSRMTGLLSFSVLQSPLRGSDFGALYPVGQGVYRPLDADSTALVGLSEHEDGMHISNGAADYIPLRGYAAQLALLTLYSLLGVTALFSLIIDIKRRRAGKPVNGAFTAVLTAAKCARILSPAAAVSALAFALTPQTLGLPRSAGTVCGCIQIVCAAVCIAGALTGGILLLLKKPAKLRSISAVFCNSAVIAAISVFELYRFWYC